jgi:hypothetical protein
MKIASSLLALCASPAGLCFSMVVTISVFSLPAGAADYWQSRSATSGSDGALCQDLHKRLNAMRTTGVCMYDAIETYPKFSEVPWEDLDPREHLELVVKLERLWQEGSSQYFKGPAQQPESAYRYRANDFLQKGGEVKVWRVRLLETLVSGTRPAPPGPQTIVTLIHKGGSALPSSHCPGKASHGWVRATFIVLPDLSGPDPAIDPGTAAFISTKWPVLYEGRPMLINPNYVAHPGNGICYYELVTTKRRSLTSQKSAE